MKAHQGFRLAVRRAFAPMMNAYGYNVVESEDSYVRLDSQMSSIQLMYDIGRSFEVGVTFSELENGGLVRRIPFELGVVYRQFGVPDSSSRSYFQSMDMHDIERFLSETCRLLLEYCQPILDGEQPAFADVNERRTREAAAYTKQLHVEGVRARADDAWRNKKYDVFVILLSELSDSLSKVDRMKLDYASRKVTNG